MTPPITPDFDPTEESFGENLSEGFHLLRSKRRRRVVWCMAYLESDESVTVRELAKHIAAVEQNATVQTVSNDAYRTVYTNLDQNHLPDLNEGSVITYDSDRQIVSPGPNAEVLAMIAATAIPALHLLLTEDF